MSIWGQLKELPLPDLLMLLEARKGELIFQAAKRPTLTLTLANGRLGRAREGKRPIPLHRLEERLFQLMNDPEAGFVFRPDDSVPTARGPELSELAVRLSVLHRETRAIEKLLPPADTEFVLVDRASCANPRWEKIFRKAKPYLAGGIAALELSELIRVPLPLVRHFLFAAKQAGKIKPKRETASRGLQSSWILGRFVPTP